MHLEKVFYFLEAMQGSVTYTDVMEMPYSHFVKFTELKNDIQQTKKKIKETEMSEAKRNRSKIEARQKNMIKQKQLYGKKY